MKKFLSFAVAGLLSLPFMFGVHSAKADSEPFYQTQQSQHFQNQDVKHFQQMVAEEEDQGLANANSDSGINSADTDSGDGADQ